MIVGDRPCHDLDEAEDRSLVPELELPQYLVVVSAEPEEGLLYEVVNQAFVVISVAPAGAQNY